MRHRKHTAKLGMKSQHKRATMANMVCSLIEHNRITTTLGMAKEARRFADKMVTLAKKGALHHRRQALAFLRQPPAVKKLFTELGAQHSDRAGGYTRIVKLGQRRGDAAEMCILEWTGTVVPAATEPEKSDTAAVETAESKAIKAKAKPEKKQKSAPKSEKSAA